MNALNAGITAFREGDMHAADGSVGDMIVGGTGFNAWDRFEARRLRYAINWAYWQNDAYRRIHVWSTGMKAEYGLYRHVRHVYNPSRRIAEFFVTHIYNGTIDPDAGDGIDKPSAIPIVVDDGTKVRDGKAIRSGLSELWRDSHWQSRKSGWVRNGSVMGDAPLMVCDDIPTFDRSGRVRLKPIHPGTLKWVDCDDDHVVRAYIREELRYDPEQLKNAVNASPRNDPLANVRTVVFTEQCELIGGFVHYKTFKDYRPYDWSGVTANVVEWTSPYPFVPLVMCQHVPIGTSWGMSESQSEQPKFREADDLASKLDDQIRKMVEAPWLYSGMKPQDIQVSQAEADRNSPEDGRQKATHLYASNPDAKAQALVADVHIGETSLHIQTILEEIERDHPELRYDRLSVSGMISGEALRQAQKPAKNKVLERRAEYDAALARAQEMALVIGGIQGYEGYAPATPEDYIGGRFIHRIADRPVFDADPIDDIVESTAEAQSISAWTAAGVPLPLALRRAGWDQEAIDEAVKMKAEADAAAHEQAMQLATASPVEPAVPQAPTTNGE